MKLNSRKMRKTQKAADLRVPLFIQPNQSAKPVEVWTDEQRRLGGAWARHELDARIDPFTAAYNWVPGWTCLTAEDIHEQLAEFYAAQ